MASSSFSISGSNPPKYDVFLSFRGVDTRTSFRSHLDYALKRSGLVTFFDDRDLETGDEISASLSNAIRSSSLSIIIFSQNYASSSWCLNELLEILECHETGGQIILQIFYHVSPSDVRYQKNAYGEAFAKHEERFKEMKGKVQNWRAALAQVTKLSGLELKPDDKQLQAEFIEKIVKDVLAKLNHISSGDYLDPGLVGIRSRVETVESLLCLDSQDFCKVGIWGMGGIGKTTIARAVYKRIANRFKAFCFLENVRNDATNGPNDLQKKLLSEILGEGNHVLNDITRRRLGGMEILIAIDDVDGSKHLKDLVGNLSSCFGPGSRIIITSRDRQVLKNVVDEFKLYEVEGLNDVEALELFSLNAFKKSHPPKDFMEISEKVVHYAKGNPLALEVLGCSLFEKSMKEWKSLLDKLKKCPDREILKVLRISYDMLDHQEQGIFLFNACFFKGEERDRVTTILNGCKFYGCEFSVSRLVDKCLVTITYDNRLSMHDLIQEMGRDVVFNESVKEPGERSRLWDPQDIYDLFKNNTGTGAVESISLDLSQISDQLYVSPDAFTRMPNLKLLKFYFSTLDDWRYDWRKERNKVKFIREGLESLPDELRYLCWPGYPLKSLPFNPEHLVDLEMPYSKLQHLWRDTKSLGKLRRIDLSECRQLTEVPDLSQAKKLESMVLDFCPSLTDFPKISSNVTLTRLCLTGTAIEKVPYSAIKCLSKIVDLDINSNTRLRNLPNMRHLTSLKTLYLSGCSKITKFPEISGAITDLGLRGTAIEEVPCSAIKCLSKIVSLDISYNKRLSNLPSMRHLTSLETLYLKGCSNITKFPEISGAITYLDLSGTAIKEVPYSAIISLSKIVSLDISSNTMLSNLPSMRHLTSLKKLDLHGCSNITEFPDISEKIVDLHLSETGIKEVPSFVGRLTNLNTLTLENCKRLEKVSSSIFQLKLQGRLVLSGCLKLENFPQVLENEGMLPNSLRNLTNLSSLDPNVIRFVYMSLCKNLESLPNSLCNLTSLSRLHLSGCPGVDKKLENLLLSSPSGLRSLKWLDLSECNMEVLPTALSRLSSLKDLHLRGNEFESLSLKLFTSLRELDISNCKRLRYLQDFPLPSRLEELIANNCTSLETLPDTNGLSEDYNCFYYYHNCFKLDERARINIKEDARSRTQLIMVKEVGWYSFCFPGSEIPDWLNYQNQGSSIKIDLPPHWYSNKFLGFVVCIVASCESSNHIEYPSYVKCKCKINDPDCDGQNITFSFPKTVFEYPKSDHVFIKSIMPADSVRVGSESDDATLLKMSDPIFNTEYPFWQKARFRFKTSKGCCKVKKCGINLVYSEWEDQVLETVRMTPRRRKKEIATLNQQIASSATVDEY